MDPKYADKSEWRPSFDFVTSADCLFPAELADVSEEDLVKLGFLGEGESIRRQDTSHLLTHYCPSILQVFLLGSRISSRRRGTTPTL